VDITRGAARLVLVASTCALLAGCTGGADPDEPEAAASTKGGLTLPGAALEVGQSATLPLEEGSGVIELTVTSIEEGDPQALTNLAGTPYYVHLEATAVSGDAYQFFVETYFGAFAGTTRVPPIATPLTIGTCTRTYFSYHPAVGSTLDTCLTYVVDPGADGIDRIAFDNRDTYRIQDETAVSWS
jgi:hypothetical protein